VSKGEATVKLSCYIDEKSYKELKKRALDAGLSISAYLRFLIKLDAKTS
jgi:hypothetical protein